MAVCVSVFMRLCVHLFVSLYSVFVLMLPFTALLECLCVCVCVCMCMCMCVSVSVCEQLSAFACAPVNRSLMAEPLCWQVNQQHSWTNVETGLAVRGGLHRFGPVISVPGGLLCVVMMGGWGEPGREGDQWIRDVAVQSKRTGRESEML